MRNRSMGCTGRTVPPLPAAEAWAVGVRLPSAAVATNPPPDLFLAPIGGEPHTVQEWQTMFHMLIVAVDPFSVPSAWIVDTAARIMADYEQSDCRVAWLVGGDELDATEFLGRWREGIMTFTDPDLTAINALGLEKLPAIVHLAMDGTVGG